MGRLPFLLSLSIICFLLLETSEAKKKSYIVYLGSHSHGPNPSEFDLESVTQSHYDLLGSYMRSEEKAKEAIFYSYTRYINGFAALLEEEEAAEIAKDPNVVSIFLNKGRKLHTTHSWDFLQLRRNDIIPKSSQWNQARFGEDVIIGNLDTGVWPEAESFNDEGMGPIPPKWKGKCDDLFGNMTKKSLCNRKLIGARYFNRGYLAYVNKTLNASFHNARDQEGHGSHTLSTAGGNFVPGASLLGHGNGTASGGSPKAHVAAYKVCWPPVDDNQCFDADILAGFEAAISDGVDILSVSLGGTPFEFFEDAISIGSFHAVANGIMVVSSAGNEGPFRKSASNLSPWMLTVAASTLDREFYSYVSLVDGSIFKGVSLSGSHLSSDVVYPLIAAYHAHLGNASTDDAIFCKNGTLDPEKVKGKIVVCLRGGDIARIDKGVTVTLAGGVGMILANDKEDGNDIIPDLHVLPASHVNYTDGRHLFHYIGHSKYPTGNIGKVKTELGTKPAPVMAAFSSRGPSIIEPEILKPDITAPGVRIIAAYTYGPSPSKGGPFNILSGTSMSCPHVAGLAGLLKTLHPDWSPSDIKSAIMTTARTKGNTKTRILDSTTMKEATPFEYGAGHIWPNRAADPGLVYELRTTDYLNFLCARNYTQKQISMFYKKPYICPKSFSLADFNYPTITIANSQIGHSVNVTRTLTNVGTPGTYKVKIRAPQGVLVSVEPNTLNFKKNGEKKEFKVMFKPQQMVKEDYVYGELKWTDGKHIVRSAIVVSSPTK